MRCIKSEWRIDEEGRWKKEWIGMRLDDPQPNVHLIARGSGCTVVTEEQVKKASQFKDFISKAAREVKQGKPVVLDVQVRPEGYSSALEKAR